MAFNLTPDGPNRIKAKPGKTFTLDAKAPVLTLTSLIDGDTLSASNSSGRGGCKWPKFHPPLTCRLCSSFGYFI